MQTPNENTPLVGEPRSLTRNRNYFHRSARPDCRCNEETVASLLGLSMFVTALGIFTYMSYEIGFNDSNQHTQDITCNLTLAMLQDFINSNINDSVQEKICYLSRFYSP